MIKYEVYAECQTCQWRASTSGVKKKELRTAGAVVESRMFRHAADYQDHQLIFPGPRREN